MVENKPKTPKEPNCRFIQYKSDIRKASQNTTHFMVLARIPGGVITPEQWLVLDKLTKSYGSGTVKLTTRQELQIFGVKEANRKKVIKEVNLAIKNASLPGSETICNVMCTSHQSKHHTEVYNWAKLINDKLLSNRSANNDFPLDQQGSLNNPDFSTIIPIDGSSYLPFKIGFAIPPSNDIDVLSQDIGFIAIIRNKKLIGFNVAISGGLESMENDRITYPQLEIIGFCKPEQTYDLCINLYLIHRDYLNTSSQANVQFKYTIDKLGHRVVKKLLEDRLGWKLEETKSFDFEINTDLYGCFEGLDRKWHITLYLENGIISDQNGCQLLTGLREIAKVHTGDIRLTASKNIILTNITKQKRKEIIELINHYNLNYGKHYSMLRRNSLACEGLPKCRFAIAEAENYLPLFLEKIEIILEENRLRNEEITIRMTGCSNGCVRHTLADIGFVGTSLGNYNMYLGGSLDGNRLSKMYRENIGEKEILEEIRYILSRFSNERNKLEPFGDFVIRKGIFKITNNGNKFNYSCT